ncbi:MAG: ribosome biogenesis GTPase Der [Candidatus Shikimatogenerans bostrichidophilus]|nr:MAG: ribosome biogenesis GTPase Der [Candidatus Shikimatogenerans bostrichidophilus]
MKRKICIVGKSNVGKSTLFNFLIKKKRSLIDKKKNTTKNNNYGYLKYKNNIYLIIDTAGFFEYKKKNKKLKLDIFNQILLAIKESFLILFVVDIKSGLSSLDIMISKILRKINKKIFLLINKIDIKKYLININDFYKLGINNIFYISCTHNIGFKKLYNNIYLFFKKIKKIKIIKNKIKISVLGVPNSGKSTFINNFFREKKTIVSNIIGTTTDSLFFYLKEKKNIFLIIDTPGIFKKLKFNIDKKKYLKKIILIIKESDICLLIIDINNYITKNDLYIYKKILFFKKGLIIIFNKIDLFKKKKNKINKKILKIFNNNYPIYYLNNKNKLNINIINKIKKTIILIFKNKNKKLNTSFINKKILHIINKKKFKIKNKILKIKFCYQLKNKLYPSFILISNLEKKINNNYKKYIIKLINKKLNFYGCTIKINLIKKKNVKY